MNRESAKRPAPAGDGARARRPEVVVVTGASAGVGRAVVREFADGAAREGRQVAIGLIARGHEGLQATRREVEASGGRALALPCDVSDPRAIARAAARVDDLLGPVDVWVNNAMISVFSPFQEMHFDEFRRVTEVVYLGYVNGTMAALRSMVPRNKGTIVQVGSGVAYRGIPLQSAYSGAKQAIKGFTEAVRTELRHDHSRVWITQVHLPAVNTPQFSWVGARIPGKPRPLKPVFEPEVCARAIYWAAHHRRREIFVSAGVQALVELHRRIPGFLEWYLSRTGVEGQMYDGAPGPEWRDYVWKPVDEDRGARGEFDEGARDASLQLWLSLHRRSVAAAGALLAGGALVAAQTVGRRRLRAG